MSPSAPFAADFGRAADDYGRHRQGFPGSFFERLREHGVGLGGQRVLDVGTGTGQMARGLARGGARVTGLDPSAELLAVGAELDRRAGLEIARVQAQAESTGFSDASFEVVTAAQCWVWFDPRAAGVELRRVLAPRGRLAITQLDWIPKPGSVVAATEELILEHNRAWPLAGLDGLPVGCVRQVEQAGFGELEIFAYDQALDYTHEAWRGRIRASAGIGGSLPPAAVERFDRAHAELLARHFPTDPLAVPHRIFALLARALPDG